MPPAPAAPTLPPLLLAIAGIGLLTAMDAVVKALGARVPTLQLSLLRFVAAALLALLLHRASGTPWPDRAALRGNLPRGLVMAASTLGFFHGLRHLPLTEVFVLSFLAPVLVGLLAPAMLGERPDGRRWAALGLGFAGVAVTVAGSVPGVAAAAVTPERLLAAAAVLGAALAYALSVVLLRRRAQRDAAVTIVLFQSAVPAIVLAIPAAATWEAVAIPDLLLFLPVGGLAVLGHLALARAFAQGEASRLVAAEYTALAWAALLGLLAFGEVPGAATLLGAALVLGACLLARG